jgi:hypothetical protein
MNAREEFLHHVDNRGGKEVLCAEITHQNDADKENVDVFWLPVGYGKEAGEKFLAMLDFEYDDTFGSQEVFGYIWFKDGTWSERMEYDGTEWYVHKSLPEIPEYLRDVPGTA